tara:strand:- start:1527 stop:2999 length:1473 start_codon:yes stop_codon:yes gene_type:complete
MKKFLYLSLFLIPYSFAELNKPNFIIIYLDDLGYADIGLYQDELLNTPNIDKLSASSQIWTNFYASSSVCTPSRAGLLTGRLPIRSGLYGDQIKVFFPGSNKGIPSEEITIADILKLNGYSTGIFGKWHLGDKSNYLPTRHGFDEWIGIPYSNDMDWEVDGITLDKLIKNPKNITVDYAKIQPKIVEKIFNPDIHDWNVPLVKSVNKNNGKFVDRTLERPADQNKITKLFTVSSIDFIERSVLENKSFFLFLSHSMPHVPLFRSKEFIKKSRLGIYGDVLEEIDWSVGSILQKLKELKIEDNTYIIFTSDNGPWLLYEDHGGNALPLRSGKGTSFEGGMRVMTFFKGPNIKTGINSDIGSQTDIFETIMSLANIDDYSVPEDSFDLTNSLKGTGSSLRDFIPYYVGSELRAFRYKDHKIHFITEGSYNMKPIRKVHEIPLLYNLDMDIGEKNELSDKDILKNEIINIVKNFQNNMPVADSILDKQFILDK